MDEFRDRVAVITGGGSGIGAEMARSFAREGADVVLADLDEEGMAAVKREVESAGRKALCVRTDVSRKDQVEALRDRALDAFGKVHIVCNNAGIATGGFLSAASHNDWVWTMNVDLWGVIHGVEVFLPRLLEQDEGGHFVNTASMAGLAGMPGLGIYCTAKFAVVGLSESMHRELKPAGIGVSVLCPMIVETRINDSERNRPPELRNADATPVLEEGGVTYGRTIPVSEVGTRVVQAVRDKDLYILTHKEQVDIIERHSRRLAEAARKYATA